MAAMSRAWDSLEQESLSPATLQQWQTCDGIRRFAYAWADAHQISKVKVQVSNAKVWLHCDCEGHRKCKKAAGEVYRVNCGRKFGSYNF